MGSEGHEGEGALSRRRLLQQGAIAGAIIWSAPVVRTLPAFGATTSPPPPGGGRDISFVAIVVTCGDVTYRVKYEDGTGWEDTPGGRTGNGCAPDGWQAAQPVNGGDLGITVVEIEPSRWQVTIPHSCGDADDPVQDARAKAGAKDNLDCEPPTSEGWTSRGYQLVFQL